MAGFTYASVSGKFDLPVYIQTWKRSPTVITNPEKLVLSEKQSFLGIVKGSGYPLEVMAADDFVILLEGVIYDPKPEFIKVKLEGLARQFIAGTDIRTGVIEFVKNADGEFIIAIMDIASGDILTFNDTLGRLSLYYGSGSTGVAISRELRHAALFSGCETPELEAVAEILATGFPIDGKTFFRGISSLSGGRLLIVKDGTLTEVHTIPLDFEQKIPFRNRKTAARDLVDLFLQVTKRRVDYWKSKGNRILCDLSGGFDSRAMLGALSHFTKDVDYITFEYVRDESFVANAAFSALDSPGRFQKLSLDNSPRLEGLENLILATDGLVNYYTTSICYQDVAGLQEMAGSSARRFGGLVGEIIRRPYRDIKNAFISGVERPLYSALGAFKAAKLVGLDPNLYIAKLNQIWGSSIRFDPETATKRFYNQFCTRYVGHAGGERERAQLWPVHPLWAPEFVQTIMEKVPLAWADFAFFADFLKHIDARLVSVPMYGIKYSPKSNLAMRFLSLENAVKNHWTLPRSKVMKPLLSRVLSLKDGFSSADTIMGAYENGRDTGLWANGFDLSHITSDFSLSPSVRRRALTLGIFFSSFNKWRKG